MSFKNLKNSALLNAKNLLGWRTKRKIVVFAVDDYGSVRLHSKETREQLDREGYPARNRFDAFDTLETRGDLEMLFDTLQSVEDKNARNAVFTPLAVPCNINFEKLAKTGYRQYFYELLPETFRKLEAIDSGNYEGTWNMWQQGMKEGLIEPQFHGREHLNLKVFEEKLQAQDNELLTYLKNRSFGAISESGYKTISPLGAFEFWDHEENDRLQTIIEDGLDQFENVFGYRATNFTPPVYNFHTVLEPTLKKNGIRFIDTALTVNEHQGKGNYKRKFNYTGKESAEGLQLIVRNVVFEPSEDRGINWPDYTIRQIEAAFRWNRPAVISSHRVNFCGHINEKNRDKGINALSELLKKIIHCWPEVEFMSARELGEVIKPEKQKADSELAAQLENSNS